MERLIADANEYAKSIGMASDLSIDSFSDIVTAIDLVQQKQGIAGTTAREAATTIAGSIGMLKAAWENLLSGIANKDADLKQLMNNVVDSAKAVVSNLLPVFDTAISGILQLLNEVAPMVGKELPSLLEKIVPPILEVTWKLFTGLIQAIPELFTTLANMIPSLAKIVIDSIKKVFGEITNPKFIKDAIKNIESSFKDYVKYFEDLAKISFKEGQKIAENVKKGYETVAPSVISTVSNFFEKIKTFINENGAETWQGILDNVKNFLLNINTILAEFVETVVNFIANHGVEILTAVQSTLTLLGEALLSFVPVIFSAIGDLLVKIQEIFLNVDWVGLAIKVFDFIINTIRMQAENLFVLLGTIIQTISTTLVTTDWMSIISKIFEILIGAITVFIPHVFQKMIELANRMISALLSIDWLGVGVTVITYIGNGLYNTFGLIPAILLDIGRKAVDFFANIDWLGLGMKIINFIVNGIRALFSLIPQILSQIGQTALNLFQSIDWLGLGSRVINFIANGIKFLITAIPNLLQTIGTNAVNLFQSIDWLGLGSKVINFIGNGIKGLMSLIPDTLKSIGQKAFNAFKSINWIDLGKNIIDGIVSGITGFAHKIYDKMTSLAKGALEKAESILRVGSPSKEFRDRVGKNIPLGIAVGIDQNKKAVFDALDKLLQIPETYDFERSLVSVPNANNSNYNLDTIKSGDVYNININQPIDTPDEIARILRTEAQYGLIGGVAIG
jgi:phage-related protein